MPSHAIRCITIPRVLVSTYLLHHGRALSPPFEQLLSITRLVKWLVLATWCSFGGPLYVTGNGYFAAWAGAFCSVLLMLTACFPQLMSSVAVAPSCGEGATETTVAQEAVHVVTPDLASVEAAQSPDLQPTYEAAG